jgi:hypothetical protein
MSEYKITTDTITVPKNTGAEGFLRVVETYLRKPRVQEISIDARGTIAVKRYVQENDTAPSTGVDFSDLVPSYIVRNTEVTELPMEDRYNPAEVILCMLDTAAAARMKPLAFVIGAESVLFSWYSRNTYIAIMPRDTLCGLPVLKDRHIPDTALILVAGLGDGARVVDARVSYKVEIPAVNTEVVDIT